MAGKRPSPSSALSVGALVLPLPCVLPASVRAYAWGQRRSVPDLFALPAGVIRCCLRLLSSLGYSPRARALEFCRVTGAAAVGDTVADNAADAALCHGADGP